MLRKVNTYFRVATPKPLAPHKCIAARNDNPPTITQSNNPPIKEGLLRIIEILVNISRFVRRVCSRVGFSYNPVKDII